MLEKDDTFLEPEERKQIRTKRMPLVENFENEICMKKRQETETVEENWKKKEMALE